MLMVGLTGGIGSGKSVVATRLAELGAVVIDSDRIAREVVARGTDGLREVVTTFGDEVLTKDGELDRAAMARRVFDDPEARRKLEQIIHPRVRELTAARVAAVPANAVVVNDVPLLVEAGLAKSFHMVIIVMAPELTRIARLTRDRGMSETEARARISAQASDAERRAVADVIIENDGTLEELRNAVDTVWDEHIVPTLERPQWTT